MGFWEGGSIAASLTVKKAVKKEAQRYTRHCSLLPIVKQTLYTCVYTVYLRTSHNAVIEKDRTHGS